MKQLAVFLILSSAAALAQSGPHSTRFSNPLLEDVVRMTKAGTPDATIVAYVKARRAGMDSMSADDLIHLRRAGAGEPVIQYLAGVAALDEGRSGEARQGDVTYDSGDGTAYPVEPAYDGGYVSPYEYGYYPYEGGGYFSTSVVFIGGAPSCAIISSPIARSFTAVSSSAAALRTAHSSPGADSASLLVRAARFFPAHRGWPFPRCGAGALQAFACRVGAASAPHDRKLFGRITDTLAAVRSRLKTCLFGDPSRTGEQRYGVSRLATRSSTVPDTPQVQSKSENSRPLSPAPL